MVMGEKNKRTKGPELSVCPLILSLFRERNKVRKTKYDKIPLLFLDLVLLRLMIGTYIISLPKILFLLYYLCNEISLF